MSSTGILLGSSVQFAYSTAANTDLSNTATSFSTANSLTNYISREQTTFGTDQQTTRPAPLTENRVAAAEIVTGRNGTFTLNGFGNWNADDDLLGDALGQQIRSGRVEQASPTGTAAMRLTIVANSVTTHEFTIDYSNAGADNVAIFDVITAGGILRLNFTEYKTMTDGTGTTYAFNDPNRVFRDRRVKVVSIDTTAKTIKVQALKDISQATNGDVVKTADGIFPTTEATSGNGGFRFQMAQSAAPADPVGTRTIATTQFSISGFTISWKYAIFGSEIRTRSWVIKSGPASGFTDSGSNKYHLITNGVVASYNVSWSLQNERQATMTVAGARFATQTAPYVTGTGTVRAAAAQVYGSPVIGEHMTFIEASNVATIQEDLAVSQISYTIASQVNPITELHRLDPTSQAMGVATFSVEYSTVDTRENLASTLSTSGDRRAYTYVAGYKGNTKQTITGDPSTNTSLENKLFMIIMPSARFVVNYDPITSSDAIRQRVTISGDSLDETLATQVRNNIDQHSAINDTPCILSFE